MKNKLNLIEQEDLKNFLYLLRSWQASGRCATYFPKLGMVSLSGKKRVKITDASIEMQSCLYMERDKK